MRCEGGRTEGTFSFIEGAQYGITYVHLTFGGFTVNEPINVAAAVAKIDAIQTEFEQLRNLLQPQGFDPNHPRYKHPDGKFTLEGAERLYRYFDEGMGVYEAAKKMQISYRAAAVRFGKWQEAGGANRVKRQLDGEARR